MSHPNNDLILDRASDVLETCDEQTAQLIKRCVDNLDLEGLKWVLDHLPKEADIMDARPHEIDIDESEEAQEQIDHDADMWEASGEAERTDTND